MTSPPAPGQDAAARLQRYLEQRPADEIAAMDGNARPTSEPRVNARPARFIPLTGDASDRRYFRITQAGQPTRIAAVHAGPIDFDVLPFAIVGRLLEAMPVRVPRVLDHDDDLGIIVLEDLGDITLQARLKDVGQAERSSLYRKAIGIITVLQRRGRALSSPDLLPYQLAFDVEKLMFEFRFFATHFLEGHLGAAVSDAARNELDLEFAAIAEELAGEPRVLCHRDYHSRNLMVHDGHLHVIDFQDARMGPDTYDLVSLLRDAYVDFTPDEVDDLIAAFLAAGQMGGAAAADFWRRFDLMAVQRTVKALGTFGFQATSRGNASYLQNVPRTLAVLRTTLGAYPRFDRLRRQLAEFIPELA